jgi:hypothetical protein
VDEFAFDTPADKSRRIAGLISPALRMGGFIRGHVPIDVMEADISQAGKGYAHELTCALYNEAPRMIGVRAGGVGSADESFGHALIEGRPFICLDNIRNRLDSTYLEMFLTSPSLFPARIPHRAEVLIDPKRFCLMLTSNGMESSRDLAYRSSITRIRKRPNFKYSDTVREARREQPYFLGCVHSVVREWHAKGKPRTEDCRHDFREWGQALDWIVQNIFKLPPLMDGHQRAQERVSDPNLSWLRAVALEVDRKERLGDELTASDIVELCQGAAIALPNLRQGVDDMTASRAAGSIMRRVFGEENRLELEGYTVARGWKNYRKTSGDMDRTYSYVFEEKR